MELHIRINDKRRVNGLTLGTAEIWSEGCEDDCDKALAQLIASNVQNTLEIVSSMSSALFEPPTDLKEEESK